jgi:hypothetical protein
MNSDRKSGLIVQKNKSPFAVNSHGWSHTQSRTITIFVTVDGVTFCLINTYIPRTALQAAGSIPDGVTETLY